MLAAQAEDPRLFSVKDDLELTKFQRDKLRALANNMTRFSMSISRNDCGGSSEYAEFFKNMRAEYGKYCLCSGKYND